MAIRGILVFSVLAGLVIAILFTTVNYVFSQETHQACEETIDQALRQVSLMGVATTVVRVPVLVDKVHAFLYKSEKIRPLPELKDKIKALVIYRKEIYKADGQLNNILYIISSYDAHDCNLGIVTVLSTLPTELDELFVNKYKI